MGRNGNSPFTHCGMRDSAVDNFIKENTMLYRISGLTAVLFAAASFVGCADTETPAPPPVVADGNGHNHGGGGHEHAETFGEAFAEVNELHENVAKAFADGDTEAAHGPLHEVGHLLDELSELADESEMSDEAKKTIDANIAVLFDTFGAVDKKMHDAEGGKDFSEVAEEISGAIAAIKEAAGEHAEAGHDEHGEHEGHDGEHEDGDHGEHADHEGHDKDGDHKEDEHEEHGEHEDHKKDGEDDKEGEGGDEEHEKDHAGEDGEEGGEKQSADDEKGE